MSSKKRFISIDIIKVLSCIFVLLYHLNILNGGFLAVCIFFTLSGYLSCISLFNKEKISLKKYYYNRLLKLYIPLILVVFISIAIISLNKDIVWFNLKPETTSILLGYNNFWQLSANQDYFARHISSPFMHLWYISILLQFDLIFPFIFIFLKKIGDKIHKIIPCIITAILSVIFTIYFYKISTTQSIMFTYYNTFTRVFSLLFGVLLGFIHSYGKVFIPKNNKYITKIIYYLYLIIILLLCIFINKDFLWYMIITTLITCRLIDYGTSINYENKIITFLSNISYEIYLVQYPIIYLFQYININTIAKNILIVIITFVISYILHISINIKKEEKLKIIKYILRIIILLISLFGLYKYCLSKDYTHEMEQLKKDLEKNQQIIEYRQKEYEQLLKQEQDDWTNLLNNLENEEQGLKDIISNLHIIGIGDSVMLGAVNELYNTFKNGYFDASISRTAWVAKGILDDLESKNIVSDTVLFNLGANGDCTLECKIKIMDSCKDKHVFWINVTNSDDVNKSLLELSTMYSNLHIIDWNSFSKGHKEYFAADNIHLTQIGKVEYTKYIYDSIYNVYLEEYNKKKEEIINKHNEELKNKISFYGNDLLLNIYDYIKDDYKDARITINSEYTYDLIKKDIINDINNELINYKVVIALDSAISLNAFEYKEIMDLFKNNEIYILITNEYAQNELLKINYENVHIINFYNEIIENDDYLLIDKIHLSKKGNEKLKDILITNLKEKPVSN